MKTLSTLLFLFVCSLTLFAQPKTVVFQTDFGLKDGAVSAMKGVAMGVNPNLKLFDLTHEIPAYNIWEAAYRLEQTAPYWPKGTVFVSVVDPGVGTERKSVVLKTKSGHYFVGPDNGSFTLIAESLGIQEVHEIDEALNRRRNSQSSYTFHGRDVYAYTAARLAAGVITLAQVGNRLPNEVVKIPFQKPVLEGKAIVGNIPILDVQYGNIWTNISADLFKKLNIAAGQKVKITVWQNEKLIFEGKMPFANTFGEVPEGQPMAYLNSLMNLSFALNMGDFSTKYSVKSGPEWKVRVEK
ncbi:SAM hydrolase/SAM-dependent halogenase family protein [Runella salmonicolor]|uniref:S-adenosyl-l-methionine hydroxide adenosyltransferase family protein n=1 Tax=Runella salmonicolor TaxID=2950278 RepID=A0ABT1FUR1_9BACT|nr:S-adenosyl-l-methionine hydroxide adenosyltransferase family protein [Runella salmonicolor]MCP1385499.1 S-adenosyl-l-methionine hydroxide adenosyltransferase family protein [Runella salmonicolor]